MITEICRSLNPFEHYILIFSVNLAMLFIDSKIRSSEKIQASGIFDLIKRLFLKQPIKAIQLNKEERE